MYVENCGRVLPGLYHKQADLDLCVCVWGGQGVCQSGNDAPLTPTILSQCIFFLSALQCLQTAAS